MRTKNYNDNKQKMQNLGFDTGKSKPIHTQNLNANSLLDSHNAQNLHKNSALDFSE